MQSWMHRFFKLFYDCKGNTEAKMIASQIKYILIFSMVCMLSSFLLGYADSHALSSLSDITTFIGFWQLACQLWLQN